MHLNPQSLRSPVSPYDRPSKNSFSTQNSCYPTTPQPEPIPTSHGANSGLGLYGCALPPLQSSATDLPPSPQPSGSWAHSSMIEREYPQSSQPPNIFSAEYDPFSGYSDGTNSGMMSVQSPEAPTLDYCQTPPSSNLQSHRSSISSFSPIDTFSSSGSDFVYTPRVKAEDRNEWYSSQGSDHVLQRGHASRMHSGYPTVVSPLNTQTDDFYRPEGADWSKRGGGVYPATLQSSPAIYRLPKLDVQPVLPSVGRTKKKRQRTTPEEATHECRICGKLFKRSYNWKSHMETHNPERKYPHPCTSMIGNTLCTKKFQRKTDLDRHHDSVGFDECGNHQSQLTLLLGTFENSQPPM